MQDRTILLKLLPFLFFMHPLAGQQAFTTASKSIETVIGQCQERIEAVSLTDVEQQLHGLADLDDLQHAQLLYCQGQIYDRLDSIAASVRAMEEAYGLAAAEDSLSELTADIADRLGYLLFEVDDIEQSIYYLQRALRIRKQPTSAPAQRALTYHNLARTYTASVQTYSRVIAYADSAISIFDTIIEPPSQWVRAYMLRGVAQEGLDDLRSARVSYEKAMLLSQNFPKDVKVVINLNLNLGNYHLKLDDHATALQYYNNALKTSLEINGWDHYKSNSIRNNIAIVKSNLKRFDEAIATAEEVLQSNIKMYGELDAEVGLSYNNIGNIYSKMKEDTMALTYFKNAERIYIAVLDPLSIDLAINHLHLGESYARVREYEQALQSYAKTLGIVEEVLGPDHIINAACHYYMGNVLADQGKFEQAMEYYDVTKEKLGYDPENISELKSKSKAADLHFNIAYSYDQWYEEVGRAELLTKAKQNYDTALDLMWSARKDYETRASADFLMRKYRTSFENALLNLIGLGAKEKLVLADELFALVDAIKSNQLKDGVLQKRALKFGNVPAAIIEKESELADSKQYLEYRLDQLKRYGQDSVKVVTDLQVQLDADERQYEKLLADMEADYPSYYNLLYAGQKQSVEQLRASLAGETEAVFNYFVGERYIVVAALYAGGCVVDSIPLEAHFGTQLQDYLLQVQDVNTQLDNMNSLLVCQGLLGNILPQLPPTIEKLTIIPEGRLSYLPFESLPLDSSGRYVNSRYSIRYGYSAQLLFAPDDVASEASEMVLAIAPEYHVGDIAEATPSQDQLLGELVRAGEYALPGSIREVENIGKIMSARVYTGSTATEQMFKQVAHKYRILHLSMHALVDDQFPLESRLVFEQEPLSEDDGMLHTYELYGLDLNADLAVLSACNTGSGKHEVGEGIMSLSRAFTYAGVPATVMSLWKVPDAATEQIMTSFYGHLAAGTLKSKALQMAKQEYIERQDIPQLRDPFYWAGFVLVGNDEAIETLADHTLAYVGAGSVLTFLLIFLYFKKK